MRDLKKENQLRRIAPDEVNLTPKLILFNHSQHSQK